jgi:hypothetical protein
MVTVTVAPATTSTTRTRGLGTQVTATRWLPTRTLSPLARPSTVALHPSRATRTTSLPSPVGAAPPRA